MLTLAEVEKVEGEPGSYNVTIQLNPRYVNEKCTCCGEGVRKRVTLKSATSSISA